MSLWERLDRRLSELLSPPPVSARPALAGPGNLGVLLGTPSPTAILPPLVLPERWDVDPESGESLPNTALPTLAPHRYRAARIAWRHGWFAQLAHRGALGDVAAATEAIEGMDAWLRQDLPGVGVGWAHASDLSVRLIHWHFGLGWLGNAAPLTLREGLAGSAAWHLQSLQARLPPPQLGLRRILHACGMVVGGFTFVGLKEARACRNQGLSLLGWELERQMFSDGVGRDRAFAWQAQVWWAVAIARAVTWLNGAPFPKAADAAFARGARFLQDLSGELGRLPAMGEEPPGDLMAAGQPLGASLRNLAVAWGLDHGDPAPGAAEDPRLCWLRASLSGTAASWAGKTWSVWSYREGGLGIGWLKVKNQPSRVLLDAGENRGGPLTHAAPLALTWQVGEVAVIADPGTGAGASDLIEAAQDPRAHAAPSVGLPLHKPELQRARVDGKKAQLHATASLPGGKKLMREVLLNQSRLIISDRLEGGGRLRLCWPLGPGWVLERTEKGWNGKNGDLSLVIQLSDRLIWELEEGRPAPEPAGWVWQDGKMFAAPVLVGVGEVGEEEVVSSFELR